ncbi:MAG: hypothetical protein KIT11_08975 [Fimbriimonadaceae bacterium]|nr:hypothetical protein [Fimbriimonadaceae bacterium]QYK55460.1 MAG: hypothetical protein KF733_10645 [Fimbriimonadaceae bacterium]
MTASASPSQVLADLEACIDRAVQAAGGDTRALDPGHRHPFHWPPHPVSADYHVLPSDWTGSAVLSTHGEEFEVQVAKTGSGVFGRVVGLWNEAKGSDLAEVLQELAIGAEPLLRRQAAIATAIGRPGRFTGSTQELTPSELVQLLYCTDRDVAMGATREIEVHASTGVYTPALIHILEDRRHPYRRVAQWCVLDMFEDLPSFCPTEPLQQRAIDAVKQLLWTAENDFARVVYKAGVVLGGHVCTDPAGRALIECVQAPSKYGRRSAIHAVFHLAEWCPDLRAEILGALEQAAASDEEPDLRWFAAHMLSDITAGETEHVTEPKFPEELAPAHA